MKIYNLKVYDPEGELVSSEYFTSRKKVDAKVTEWNEEYMQPDEKLVEGDDYEIDVIEVH